MRRKLIWLVIGAALFSTTANADLFSISVPVFSARVSERPAYEPLDRARNGRIDRAALVDGLVWISFTVLGGPRAVEELTQKGSLAVNLEISCNGRVVDRSIPIGIGQGNWYDNEHKLLSELENQGYFTWRTRARTRKVHCNTLTFRVYDRTREVVSPPGDTSVFEKTLTIAGR